jgi:hypothetical protein
MNEGITPPFLTSALDGIESLVSRLDRFTPRNIGRCTCSVEGWVGSRAGLGAGVEESMLCLPGIELRPLSP